MSLYLAFAEVLDYPTGSIAVTCNECIAGLNSECPEAAAALAQFRTFVDGKSLGTIEELYTNAFDLRPDCTPNLGYHMFGDDSRRGVFLAEMKGRLDQAGIAAGVELPDHVGLVLRYINAVEAERTVLVEDCLLPSLSRMADVLVSGGNPYQFVLQSLVLWLRHTHELNTQPADLMEV